MTDLLICRCCNNTKQTFECRIKSTFKGHFLRRNHEHFTDSNQCKIHTFKPRSYSLRACAGEYRDAVELAEYTINNQKDYILEELYKRKPDVLCFSCYIWNIDYVTDIAREYKKLCPSVPIWVGGPEVSYEVEAFLRENPYIDGVMIARERIPLESCAVTMRIKES